MNSKQKETIQRITAQYVAEAHAGHRPKVSTYIARYPQYANEIADFVAYFHAFEEDIPEDVLVESQSLPALSATFRIAIESANARIVAENKPATHLPQVAEASGPYELNKPSTEEI